MIRRKFLQLIALSSAIAPLKAVASASSTTTVIYQVKGFSCITCAVGLDTIYSRMKGIVSSHSTYPDGEVIVRFDPASITPDAVRAVITDYGFTIAAQRTA
jgi:copper chaperone CopZ